MMRRPAVALLIGLLAAIIVGALGYFLLVGPKKAAVDKTQKEIESVENQITEQKNTFKQLSDIKNRSAEFEAKLASLQAKIPQQPELPSLIRNLQAAADPVTGAGLPWLSFTPAEITAGTGSGFSSYDFSMKVAGFYSEVVDLIYRMERMERAIVVKTVTMAPTQSILDNDYSPNLGLVNVDIAAKTFTFASPSGTSTPTTPTPQTTPGTSTPTSPAAPTG
jgi:type IV pilus assembly protein PilO